MKKNMPVIIALIAIIAVSIWYGFTDKTHIEYDNNINTAQYNEFGVPGENIPVGQTFVCREDVINAFLIKANPVGNRDETIINIAVRDPETGEVISEGTSAGIDVKARKFHKITVDPVKGYKGRELILEISEQNCSEGNGITLYYQPDESSVGGFTYNGEARSGVLVMKTVTQRFDPETSIVMFISIMFIWVFMWFLYRLFK